MTKPLLVEEAEDTATTTPTVKGVSEENDEDNFNIKRRMIFMSEALPKVKILTTELGYLNVRSKPYIEARIIERLEAGELYEYKSIFSDWYEITLSENEIGWVSGRYVEVVE